MRIALCIYGNLDALTGGFLYDRFLVQALRRRGHEVDVIALPWKAYGFCLWNNLARKVWSRMVHPLRDLILQDELCHPSFFRLNRRLRFRGGVPIVSVVHQVLCRQPRHTLFNRFYELVERSYLQSVDGLLCNSSASCQQVRMLIGKDVPHRVVTPGGDRLGRLAGEELIVDRSRKGGPLELLFVGHISPIKGLFPLIESLGRLPSHLWRLTVVGSATIDVRYARSIRNLVAAKDMAAQVEFLGVVDGEDLRELYVRSQVFVMPFAHEAFGIAALEAMAFGLPVMGSSAGGVREFVRHGENGFLVSPPDYDSVRRYVEYMYHDREKLAEMGKAAIRTFRTRPTWSVSMDQACDFLETMAGPGRTSVQGGNRNDSIDFPKARRR